VWGAWKLLCLFVFWFSKQKFFSFSLSLSLSLLLLILLSVLPKVYIGVGFWSMSLVQVEKKADNVFWFWLCNGEENRLTCSLLGELSTEWKNAVDDDARAIILSSRSRFFCNGVDLSETGRSPDVVLAKLVGLCQLILRSGVPSIALLNGHAVGGGFLLALACDYRVGRKDKGFFFVPAM
jgi:enoyl-CoA hydratase/carnithine racemase